MKYAKIFAVIFFFLALTTCQSISSIIQEPKLSLKSVDIANINLSGIDLITHIDIENPNSFALPTPKIDWAVAINTNPFINGIFSGGKSINPREKVTVDFPINIPYDALYKTFTSLANNNKEAAYSIALGLSFPLPVLENKVFPFNFSGQIPLPQLPKLLSGTVGVAKMDFSGLTLACVANIENPNNFPIPLPKMNWDYNVSGKSLLKSSSTKAGQIAASSAGAANFEINIAYADIFSVMDSLKNATEVKGNLLLGADFSMPSVFDETKNTLNIPATIPILQMPAIAFQGITRKSLGRTMEFDLALEVDNKNNFAFNLDNFLYDFKVNNSQWAQGQISNPPKVKASGKTLIPLTVSVSSTQIVAEIVDIINRGSSINYVCSGSTNFISDLPGLNIQNYLLDLQGSTRIR
jgi:LEA14-like dessication related protein